MRSPSCFPEGERFFIRSVLAYREQISDPKLLQEIREFCAQEAQHTLVHEAMNALAARHGYPVAKLESLVRRDLRRFSNRGKKSSGCAPGSAGDDSVYGTLYGDPRLSRC